MTSGTFRNARRTRGLTQSEAAARLGVSQSYVALLEQGKRSLTPSLARKAARLLKFDPSVVPCPRKRRDTRASAGALTRQLSALGYPGYAHLRAGWQCNPAVVLVDALQMEELDPRVAEALPWVLIHHPGLDRNWLVEQVRLHGLTNRLGFFVSLTLRVLERAARQSTATYRNLHELEELLDRCRLEAESSFAPRLSLAQQEWVRQNRPEEAEHWHILTTWRPEHLPYV